MQAPRLPARHGFLWLAGGFALFRRNPPMLTALSFSYLLLVIMVNLIPVIGPFLLPIALPTLTAMLGNGCHAVESGQPLTPNALVRGLSAQRVGLLRLGGLHLAGSTVLVIVSLALGAELRLSDGMDETEAMEMAKNLAILLLLASPLLMAFWFAPLLTLWDDVPALKSVFFSFVASWRNWPAFTMYGLAIAVVGVLIPGAILLLSSLISGSVVAVLALALRMMLIFVLAPTLVASVYLSYRDVFHPSTAVDADG